jgi:competence protein ComEA
MIKPLCAAVLLGISVIASHAAPAEANTATQAQLESVTGLGPALAQRLLDARQQGPFNDWRDLLARVTGLGPASAARLSAAGLTVNGEAFTASTTAKPPRKRQP